jgi:hypothetical protein
VGVGRRGRAECGGEDAGRAKDGEPGRGGVVEVEKGKVVEEDDGEDEVDDEKEKLTVVVDAD